ncbi:hypothetical protein K8R32_00620 [bacterium]|nr:hypothetical protein [bacterium]
MSILKNIIMYKEAMEFVSVANKSFAESFEKKDVPIIIRSLKSIADGLIESLVNILKALAIARGRGDLFSNIKDMEDALKYMAEAISGIKGP